MKITCVFVCLFFISCSEYTSPLNTSDNYTEVIIKKIPLSRISSNLVLKQDSIKIFFSRDYVQELLMTKIDTLKFSAEVNRTSANFAERLEAYTNMIHLLDKNEYFEIPVISTIDSLSLQNVSYSELLAIIEQSDELRFGMHFMYIHCDLLESGQLSFFLNGLQIDTIVMIRYDEIRGNSGSSGIKFTTSDSLLIHKCIPDFRYN